MDPQIGGACPIVAGEEAAAVEVMVVVDVVDPQIEGACFIEEAAVVEVMVAVLPRWSCDFATSSS